MIVSKQNLIFEAIDSKLFSKTLSYWAIIRNRQNQGKVIIKKSDIKISENEIYVRRYNPRTYDKAQVLSWT